jgi:hypothetical protein
MRTRAGSVLRAARGKQVAQGGRHHGRDADEPGTLRQQLSRTGEYIGELFDFSAPTPRQHCEHAIFGAELEFGSRRGAIDFQRNLVGERVTDESGAYAMLAIEIRFEREQAQHQVHRLADGAHAPLAPGPDLRTHVLDRGRPARLSCRASPDCSL